MDYPITSYLPCALRHLESSPRLAAKYLIHPATLQGRKFDLRYYVIVSSLQPLVVHRHEMFSIRLANHVYSCDDLEQVQIQRLVANTDSFTAGVLLGSL